MHPQTSLSPFTHIYDVVNTSQGHCETELRKCSSSVNITWFHLVVHIALNFRVANDEEKSTDQTRVRRSIHPHQPHYQLHLYHSDFVGHFWKLENFLVELFTKLYPISFLKSHEINNHSSICRRTLCCDIFKNFFRCNSTLFIAIMKRSG